MPKHILYFVCTHYRLLLGVVGWLILLIAHPLGWQPPIYADY